MDDNNQKVETLIKRLDQAKKVFWHSVEACKEDRNKMSTLEHYEILNDAEDEDYIHAYISSFSHIYHSLSDVVIDTSKFPDGGSDQLDPNKFSEWVDAWPILDNPVVANWIIKYGEIYPSFVLHIYSVEELRNLLIKIKNI